MVQYGRSSRSSWTKFIWSSFGRTTMGKAIWEDLIKARLGENSKLGMSLCTSWKRIILICVCGRHQIGWKETNNWSDVEVTQQRSRFGRTNIFLGSCVLGLHSKTMWKKKQRYCRQIQSHVWITNFRGWNWNTTILGKYSYFFVVLRYGRSSQEMCGTILWVGKQNDSTTQQSVDSMYRWPSLQRRRIGSRGRIVKSMLSICCEMLVLGTHWTTWYSLVSEQTCTIDHKMDQSMWQTIISFDLLHSSYMWIQTVLPCGKHCTSMFFGTVSRLRFCRRSRWKIVRFFWKSYVCSNQLDVYESNLSFTQFNRIRNHFLECRIEVGWYPRTWFVGSHRRSSWKHVSE